MNRREQSKQRSVWRICDPNLTVKAAGLPSQSHRCRGLRHLLLRGADGERSRRERAADGRLFVRRDGMIDRYTLGALCHGMASLFPLFPSVTSKNNRS